MVEVSPGKKGGTEGDCGGSSSSQGDAVAGRICEVDRRLTKDMLEMMFAQENPHEQFRLFARCLWSSGSASMSTPVRITAEYDFHNIIFCREQNFTVDQTIAFRGITLSVFEATIVRGELDLEGAFEAFTERVLSLAEVPETHAAHAGTGGNSSRVEPGTSTVSAAEGSFFRPVGGEGGAADSGGGGRERGPVFSVGEVDAITRFVARGLYRNFMLYRMCFEQEVKTCSEIRQVRVETPLEQPPLLEAESA